MEQYYVGLDVHSRESVFVIERDDGQVIARGKVRTTAAGLAQLRDAYQLPAETPVALETGTVAFFVARELAALGFVPQVFDAAEVRLKAYRPRQKSDGRDAFELCEGLRRRTYRTVVHVPPPAISALRLTLGRRRHFVRLATAQVTAAKHLVRGAGRGPCRQSLRTEAGWAKLFATLDATAPLALFLRRHHRLWQAARAEVTALEADLDRQAAPYAAALARLQTVPAVGPLVALTAIAVLADVARFPTAKHAASYTGLVPATAHSADRERYGHITKQGSAELRAMLCEAAQHAARPTHPLYAYFAARCARHGYKHAVIAVAHRLCRILFALLRDETIFAPAKLGLEEGRFERRTIHAYRRIGRRAGR